MVSRIRSPLPTTNFDLNALSATIALKADTASLAGLQSQINALAALIGSGGSPSIPTVTTNVAFAGALTVGTQQTITPAKWSGTSVTVSSASPAVVTWASHGLQIGAEVIFNASGSIPTGITAGAVYYIITAGFAAGSFRISTTPEGTAVNTTTTGSGVTVDGVIPSSRLWHVYENGIIDSFPNRTTPAYTPDAGAAGLPVFVIEEATARNGSGQVQSTSAPVTVAAPSVFTAIVQQATLSGTEGQAITPVAPVVFSGNTGAVSIAISPPLTGTGLSINATTGVVDGTRTIGLGALTGTYTVTGTDAAAPSSPVSAQFTMNIAASTITPLAGFPLAGGNFLELQPHADQSYASFSGTVTINSIVRVTPANGMFTRRIAKADSSPSGDNGTVSVRNEFLHIDQGTQYYINNTETMWFSFAFRFLSSEVETVFSHGNGDDSHLIMQSHTEMNGDTNPDIALVLRPYNAQMHWITNYSADVDTGSGIVSASPTVTQHSQAYPTAGTLYKFVVMWRAAWQTSDSPLLRIWQATNNNTYSELTLSAPTARNFHRISGTPAYAGGSYLRNGFYRWPGYWPASGPSTLAMEMSRIYAEKTALDKLLHAQASLASIV